MVLQNLEPADPGQCFPAQAHRGAEAVAPSKRAGQERARQKAVRDLRTPQKTRQSPERREASVEGGDQADPARRKRGSQAPEVVAPGMNVRIGDNQDVVPCRG